MSPLGHRRFGMFLLKSGLRLSVFVCVMVMLAGVVAADVPRLVSYQGRLTDPGGEPAVGLFDLTITLYASESEPNGVLFSEEHLDVYLDEGIFTILIGDQTPGGVPDSAFDADEVWLGVSVDGQAELAPRTQIGMVPFAAKAAAAEWLAIPGTFAPALTVDPCGLVGIGTTDPQSSLHVFDQRTGSIKIEGGTEGSPSQRAVLTLKSDIDWRGRGIRFEAGDDDPWFAGVPYYGDGFSIGRHATEPEHWDNALMMIREDGRVGIGTSNPTATLDVVGEDIRVSRLNATAIVQMLRTGPASNGNSVGEVQFRGLDSALDNTVFARIRGISQDVTDGSENGDIAFRLLKDGALDEVMRLTSDGKVGIGTEVPIDALQVGTSTDAGHVRIGPYSGDYARIVMRGNASEPTNRLDLLAGPSFGQMISYSNLDLRSQGYIGLSPADNEVMRLTSDGKVGIGTDSPDTQLTVRGPYSTLHLSGQGGSGAFVTLDCDQAAAPWSLGNFTHVDKLQLRYGDTDAMSWHENGRFGIGTNTPDELLTLRGLSPTIHLDASGGSAGGVEFTSDEGGSGWRFGPHQHVNRMSLIYGTNTVMRWQEDGNVGIGTATPSSKLEVAGTTRTQILEITGGADLAEPFEVNGADNIKPGMVVCIDPENPGQLRLSAKPYDKTVAGIISGANGLNPGLTMKQEGTLASGAHPVALTGRVYCWCDARSAPIAPGDLLTTSDTQGYGMKVTDHARSSGTIVGKAMSRLESGRGLVLVLVSLQ